MAGGSKGEYGEEKTHNLKKSRLQGKAKREEELQGINRSEAVTIRTTPATLQKAKLQCYLPKAD